MHIRDGVKRKLGWDYNSHIVGMYVHNNEVVLSLSNFAHNTIASI